MKTKILLAAVAGALVLPVPMASQADVMGGTDFTIYGRVVAGVDRQDSDVDGQSAVWDLGATGRDGSGQQQSRLGFKADRDLGGMTVGFKMEQGINSGGSASLNTRHRYVYMSGDFGTLTLGMQSNPYLMGANWAQEWYLGGNTVGSFREEGIGYAWSNNAFNLNVLLTGNNGEASAENEDAETLTATVDADPRTTGDQRESQQALAHRQAVANSVNRGKYRTADETIDRTIIGASYDFGVVKVGVGYNKDNTENDYDWTAIGVSGSVDRFGYYFGYQQKSDARQVAGGTSTVGKEDQDGWGVFLSYDLSDADKVYLEYETLANDFASAPVGTQTASGAKYESTYTVLGYSHNFGGSARFIGEYRTTDHNGANHLGVERPDPSRLTLTVMVSF